MPSPVPPAPAPRAPPPYALARSARAKRVTLRAVHGRGLVVTVPARLSRAAAETAAAAAVERHRDWAIGALAALRESVPEALRVWPPRSLELPALGRRVVLGFEPDGNGRRVRARVLASSVGAETVLALPCAPQAREAGVRALRAWLAREARTALGARLETLARRHGLGYARLAVRGQRTRWGSCSSSGTISLNWKLVFLPPDSSTTCSCTSSPTPATSITRTRSGRCWRGSAPTRAHSTPSFGGPGRACPHGSRQAPRRRPADASGKGARTARRPARRGPRGAPASPEPSATLKRARTPHHVFVSMTSPRARSRPDLPMTRRTRHTCHLSPRTLHP